MLLFAALAPVSLVALPFAALLVAAQPGTRGEWLAVALAGGAGLALAWRGHAVIARTPLSAAGLNH